MQKWKKKTYFHPRYNLTTFRTLFGGQNDDDGGHIRIHEGVWEYMAGRGYMGIRGDECGRPARNIKWLMSTPLLDLRLLLNL